MITKKKMIAVCATVAVVMGWGLVSCTLEPSVDSPNGRIAALPEGMPDGLAVSEPKITYNGNTIVLTYTVRVSDWPADGLSYKAEADAKKDEPSPEPLPVSALILRYGALFSPEEPIEEVEDGTAYFLKPVTPVGGGKPLSCVIIPLDTSFIRDYLKKKLMIDEGVAEEEADPPLGWIEESPAIGLVEAVDTEEGKNWKDGVYEDDGIRIGGFYKEEEEEEGTPPYPISTIENFDDGKKGRIRSIATVLIDGTDRSKQRYTSAVNFYAGDKALEIEGGVPQGENKNGSLSTVAHLKQWMKLDENKPVLRVVYQWAN
jgi:hypothetical protein